MLSIDLVRRRLKRQQCARPECVLLMAPSSRGQIVSHRCSRAARDGVQPGIPVAQAKAVLTTQRVLVETHDPEADRKALAALAVVCQSLSPITSADEPDGLLADVSGCHRVFEGEEGLVRAALSRFRDLGFEVRAAIASTYGCARAVARFGPAPDLIIPDGAQRGTMATLPTRALGCDAKTEQALREVGLDTVGHILALPRSVLPARFGDEILFRLDQALGHAIETIDPVHAVDPVHVERIFEGPNDQFEVIQLTVRGLLEELRSQLQAREAGTTRLLLRMERSDTTPLELRFALSAPTRDLKHLWSLIRPRLEKANLGFGVELISITSTRTVRINHRQAEQWRDDQSDASPSVWMDTMVNRFGSERVVRVRPAESHVPERAVRRIPPLVTASRAAMQSRPNTKSSSELPTQPHCCAAQSSGEQWHLCPVRPSLLLHPESALVTSLCPDGPVMNIRWRGIDHAIALSFGPERIEPEWWRGRAPSRDYFRVQDTQGRWLWLFREHEGDGGEWFVHGVWA